MEVHSNALYDSVTRMREEEAAALEVEADRRRHLERNIDAKLEALLSRECKQPLPLTPPPTPPPATTIVREIIVPDPRWRPQPEARPCCECITAATERFFHHPHRRTKIALCAFALLLLLFLLLLLILLPILLLNGRVPAPEVVYAGISSRATDSGALSLDITAAVTTPSLLHYLVLKPGSGAGVDTAAVLALAGVSGGQRRLLADEVADRTVACGTFDVPRGYTNFTFSIVSAAGTQECAEYRAEPTLVDRGLDAWAAEQLCQRCPELLSDTAYEVRCCDWQVWICNATESANGLAVLSSAAPACRWPWWSRMGARARR